MFARPLVRRVLLAFAGALGLVLLLFVALWIVQRGAVLPNTQVAGIDVSGMEPDEARSALAPLAEEREERPVVLTFQDTTHELDPADVDFAVDVDATAEAALGRGRDGLVTGAAERVRSLWTEREVPVVDRWDEEALESWVSTTADEIDREESLGSVSADPETLEVDVELPHGSAEVRREETHRAVVDALRDEGPREFEVPADTTEQPIEDGAVEETAEQVREAIAEPLELRVEDASMTVSPTQLARLLSVRADDAETGLELVVSSDAVEEVLEPEASSTFDVSPRDATYELPRTPPTEFDEMADATFSPISIDTGITPSADGRSFDVDMAAEQLTELVRAGNRQAELRVEVVEPDLGDDQAEELAPTHLLGTFTTYYQAGQVRNQNIQLLADVIDGAQVMPGEQFSINAISGERSCDKGYEPAGTIVRGELVDTCGGGTSQFGTTTFNAAFFAGMQLNQWKAHSWYISRYPMGREATLSYPHLDVVFTNTGDGVVVVKTTHDDTSVTVSVYGQPVSSSVSATHGQPYNERSFTTEERTTSDLPRGRTEVVQSGTDGFTVDVTRSIDRPDGSNDSHTITTVYEPQTRIIERGTG
jgi:vancomycin resistance protein YoaR